MDRFINFLIKAKDFLKNLNSSQSNNIHIVMGNESCDLDSTVSALLLAYFINNNKTSLKLTHDTVVVPVMNLQENYFDLRTHTTFLLNEFNISKNLLVFKKHINLDRLLESSNLTISLVDHHILNEEDRILENNVIQIFDHRPIDPTNKWDTNKTFMKIQEVGSCATLIAETILQKDEKLLDESLAYLLYETIIFDTIALVPEKGRAKDLDVVIGKELETKFHIIEDRQLLFDKILNAYKDISGLTPKQLLYRDLKLVNEIPIPGLSMLVKEYLEMNDSYASIVSFCEEHISSIVLLIGINYNGNVQRDIGIYWKNDVGENLKNDLVDKLTNAESTFGYNFCYSPVNTKYDNIICLKQNNVKLTRKQIIPIVKSIQK